MKSGYKMLRDCVFHNPLALFPLLRAAPKFHNIVENYLPYSIGIEVECSFKNNMKLLERLSTINSSTSICSSGLIAIDTGDFLEKRFRISSGIEGLIALYHVCEFLKKYCTLNNKSGIHYHVDFTKHFSKLTHNFIIVNENWILNQLDSWGYTGKFNKRKVTTDKTWVRFHPYYKTMEVRIGEMSFEYDILIKRILHCCYIAKILKARLYC